jgi:hypothetical protein
MLYKGYLKSVLDAVQEVIDLEKELKALLGDRSKDHAIKVRTVYVDDKSNDVTPFVDYLHDRRMTPSLRIMKLSNAWDMGLLIRMGPSLRRG